ncbi:secreted RxLR effector protein 161-like [Jatropha curcas]|uniref:secreted RxLR effector protein 161-like n=1 Tax=Jatropha curcas TaxID=180498 RepID=UPI001894629D|nr:secreted RxLR effector protein 161-like [Jatropha curcas]
MIVKSWGLKITEGAELADNGASIPRSLKELIGVVSQFMHKPQVAHMEATLRIVKYLKGTPGRGVLFQKHGYLEIQAYTNADWAGNPIDRRSTSRYFTLVGGNLVTWRSKKQKVVALSSAEVEFRRIARGLAEVL